MRPRILHFHDCADVAGALVRTARARGITWDYLSAEAVRPSRRPSGKWANRVVTAGVMARNYPRVLRADLLHIHYAMVVPEAQMKPMPQRPYFLHLHGTDIRKHWAHGRRQSRVQRYIDGALKVYYTNLDTRDNAEEARADAEYMPAFIEPDRLVDWNIDEASQPVIAFASRWEEIKGSSRNLELAAALVHAFPHARVEGIDWGQDAPEAASRGVVLVPKMDHGTYARWLSRASVVVGQAQPMFGVSEFEAMATGIPVAALGSRIPRPDDGTTPPVLEGSVDEVVDQIREALDDPRAVSARLDGARWALEHHLADPYVDRLHLEYQAAWKALT